MRLLRTITIICIATLPQGATGWSFWGSEEKEEEVATQEDEPKNENEIQHEVVGDAAADDVDPMISGFPNFANWFRAGGGVIDDRITIGYEPGTKIRGMISTSAIPIDTLLIHTPGSLVTGADGPEDGLEEGVGVDSDQCVKVRLIRDEMAKGSESKWHTYFQYDGSDHSHIPSQWDRSGRAIAELQGLPPSGDTHRHIDWYQYTCIEGREMTDNDWSALSMILTRAADIGLIPMYDLMNHHNGKINTRLERDDTGGLKVFALHDIPANEPIYNTYARSGWESTVDVFNTYAFVEDYPQLWRWNDHNLERLHQENENHAQSRYSADLTGYEPNTGHYEVLLVTPTLAALHPTKKLVSVLGNTQRSLDEWERLIKSHHSNVNLSHAYALHDSAVAIMNELPTSIEEDIAQLKVEKQQFERVSKVGRVDMDKKDVLQAIEYRIAFKKALKLAIDTAEKERFLLEEEL